MQSTNSAIPASAGIEQYVPAWLTRLAEHSPKTLEAPGCVTLQGAVLLADVSGFTQLAERLRSHGSEGAELLWRQVDGYFGRMMQIIRSFGGEVQRFPGDAAIVLFEEREGEDPLGRAAACGLALQELLGRHPTGDGEALSMRVALSAGALQAAWVGGEANRWEAIVVSDALTDLGEALKTADIGEVVVSRRAASRLPGDVRHTATAGGHRLLVRTPGGGAFDDAVLEAVSPEARLRLRSFIPQAVRERIDAGHARWLAELRSLSVLIASVHGIHDAGEPIGPGVLGQLQEVFETLQTAVYRYGGSINLFLQDDKGIVLVAAWGLPGRAHEDDAARAVRAALQMQAALAGQTAQLSIGVARGKVFCGQRGGEGRLEYGILGSPVNLAARLAGASEGGLLCGPDVHRQARDRLHFERGEALQLKGIDAPVQVWLPATVQPEDVRSSRPVFGRAVELEKLAALAARLEAGEGGTVLIEGEPGVGKSSLVRAMGRDVDARGLRLLRGAGDAIDRQTAYHAFRGVFEDLIGLEAQEDPVDWLVAHPAVGELAPLFGPLLRLAIPDNQRTAAMVGQSRAETALEAYVAVLAGLERPVFVVDDIQWLDTASWQLLRAVRRERPEALFVLTTRPARDYPSQAYSALIAEPGVQHLALGPLDTNGIDALLASRLGVDAVDGPLKDFIMSRSQGLPFYAEEIASAMRDEALLQISGGEGAPSRAVLVGAEPVLPPTLEGVITSRIDRLSAPQQLAIKAASVIGRDFLAGCVRDIYPVAIDAEALGGELEALVHSDLIEVTSEGPARAYRFKHVITQEVVYGMLPFEQRRSLHRAVALWLEAGNAGDLSAYYPRIAWHWQHTGEVDKAIDALEAAAEQAFGTFAEQEAVDFLSAALALVSKHSVELQPRRLARWHRVLGEARMRLGHLEGALDDLKSAIALLGYEAPTSGLGVGLRLMGELARQTARYRGWSQPSPAPDADARLEAANAYLELSLMAYFLRQIPLVLYGGVRGLNLAEDVGPSPDLARALAGWGVIMSGLPLHDAAEAYSLRAVAIAEQFDDRYSLGNAQHYRGVVDISMGRHEAGIASASAGRENYTLVGNGRRVQEATNTMIYGLMPLGRYDDVEVQVKRLIEVADARGDQQALFWAQINQTELAWRRGRGLAVLEGVDESTSDDEVFVVRLRGLRVLLLLDAGDLDGAAAAAAPLQKLGRPTSFLESHGYFGLFRYALAAARAGGGTPRRARKRARQMVGFSAIFPAEKPLAGLALAELAEGTDDVAGARRAAEDCLTVSRALKTPWEEAQALRLLARISEGEEAARHAAGARAIAERLGITWAP